MADTTHAGRNGGVYLVSAARTPIGKFGGALSGVPAVELGGVAIRAAIERSGLPAETPIDEVLMGQVHPGRRRPGTRPSGGPARRPAGHDERDDDQQGLRIGPEGDHARRGRDPGRRRRGGRRRRHGEHERRPVSPAPGALRVPPGRRGQLVDATVHDALWCAVEECHVGTHAERTAISNKVSREDQDAFALRSHQKAIAAIDAGRFDAELAPVTVRDAKGRETIVADDEGPRRDSTIEALARLKPAFDLPEGEDRGDATERHGDGRQRAGHHRRRRGDGRRQRADGRTIRPQAARPDHRLCPGRHRAEVALPRPRRWASGDCSTGSRCRSKPSISSRSTRRSPPRSVADGRELGFDWDKVNVNGGAIALGHPVGASGARIVATLLHELAATKGRYGLATLCLGGGGSVAMAFERV